MCLRASMYGGRSVLSSTASHHPMAKANGWPMLCPSSETLRLSDMRNLSDLARRTEHMTHRGIGTRRRATAVGHSGGGSSGSENAEFQAPQPFGNGGLHSSPA
jgi:hypothetical protein